MHAFSKCSLECNNFSKKCQKDKKKSKNFFPYNELNPELIIRVPLFHLCNKTIIVMTICDSKSIADGTKAAY